MEEWERHALRNCRVEKLQFKHTKHNLQFQGGRTRAIFKNENGHLLMKEVSTGNHVHTQLETHVYKVSRVAKHGMF